MTGKNNRVEGGVSVAASRLGIEVRGCRAYQNARTHRHEVFILTADRPLQQVPKYGIWKDVYRLNGLGEVEVFITIHEKIRMQW